MSEHNSLWDRLLTGPHSQGWLNVAMERVACGLSDMVGQPIINDTPQIKTLLPAQASTRARSQVIGIYLEMEGCLSGQAILMLPQPFALNLADIVMGASLGTTTRLGPVEQSALAEIGNLALSYFLNAVASLIQEAETLRPSPPNVMVDQLDTILNKAIGPWAEGRDDLLIVDTTFKNVTRTMQVRLWLLPGRRVGESHAQD